MRPLPIALFAATLLAFAADASQAGNAAPSYDPKAAFAATDTNADGQIDLSEFQVRIVDVFFAADADKDGYLSPDELSRLPFAEAFEEADKDANGRLTMSEFVRVRILQFEKIDGNQDGELSFTEVEAAYEGKQP